jgi:hypothetical protein
MRPWRAFLSATLVAGISAVAAFAAGSAEASPSIRYGIEDDAWLLYGPGTLDSRLTELDRLGVDIVRFSLRWDQIAQKRPSTARDPDDPAYAWSDDDLLLKGLRRHGIAAVVTLVGTPSWANGGRSANWEPRSATSFANFAFAAARRYSWVHDWSIWNEPNQPAWLRPTSAEVYVERLLNPAYAQIHAAIPDALVAGGMTSPRGGAGGVSPVAWIRAMGAAHARLDAYAHHPYPNRPQTETPWGPACSSCSTITMAELDRLLSEVRRTFGQKRVWLTEYGYQTNPPDRLLGVSPATQARYVASAARRAYLASSVDMLIYYLVQDDAAPEGWQSGLFTASGVEKPSYTAFRLPLTEVTRSGSEVTLWGQIRARSGRQPYKLRRKVDGSWSWVGGVRWTNSRGFFDLVVRAARGSDLQVWSPRDRVYSLALRVT